MTQRDRIVLAVLGAALMLGGFYIAVVRPQRAELAELDAQQTKQVERRDAAQLKVTQGEAARKGYAEDYETIVRLGRAVPVDDQVPSLVFGLEATGRRHAVDLRNLKLRAGSSTAAAAPAATTPAQATGAAPAGSAVPATPAAAAVAPPGSQVGPAGFPTLPFDFEFEGDFFGFERFLSDVERYSTTMGEGQDVDVRGRLITVDGFGLKASELRGFPRVSAAVTATTYVDPEGAQVLSSATPAGPSAAAGTTTTAGTAPSSPKPASPTTTATVRGATP